MGNTFTDDLAKAIERYPNLQIQVTHDGTRFLRGILDIPDDNAAVVGSFFIEIYPSEGYPYRFPLIYEVGGDIRNEADWHKYADGRCCITVPPDEILKCKNGISIHQFIDNFAIPYFANQIYRKVNGHYKNGEFAHGPAGLFQFYENLFNSRNTEMWLDNYRYTFLGKKMPCGRNDKCFCESGVKFKMCHLKIFDNLRAIGQKEVFHHFNLII